MGAYSLSLLIALVLFKAGAKVLNLALPAVIFVVLNGPVMATWNAAQQWMKTHEVRRRERRSLKLLEVHTGAD